MFYTQQMLQALGYPDDPRQCVHADVSLAGVSYCKEYALKTGPNGWVCTKHQPKPRPVAVQARDLDQEIVESIILTDQRAIARSK